MKPPTVAIGTMKEAIEMMQFCYFLICIDYIRYLQNKHFQSARLKTPVKCNKDEIFKLHFFNHYNVEVEKRKKCTKYTTFHIENLLTITKWRYIILGTYIKQKKKINKNRN